MFIKTNSIKPHHIRSLLSIPDLQKKINEFQSLDYKTSSLIDFDMLFRKIIPGFFVTGFQWGYAPIIRARKHSNPTLLFDNIKDLIYPINPPNHGRFNNIGESIFYGSDDKDTAMAEMRLKVGDRITILQSKRINRSVPLFLMEIGVKNELLKDNSRPKFKESFNKEFAKLKTTEEKTRYKIIEEFLVNEITKTVQHYESHMYKSTIPIGNFYIKGNPDTEGLYYPATSRPDSYSVALKPNSYHKFFKPEACNILRVTKIKSNGSIDLFVENASTSIDENGKIYWTI